MSQTKGEVAQVKQLLPAECVVRFYETGWGLQCLVEYDGRLDALEVFEEDGVPDVEWKFGVSKTPEEQWKRTKSDPRYTFGVRSWFKAVAALPLCRSGQMAVVDVRSVVGRLVFFEEFDEEVGFATGELVSNAEYFKEEAFDRYDEETAEEVARLIETCGENK